MFKMKKDLMRDTVIKCVSTSVLKYIGAAVLFILLVYVAFWIRIQGVDTIPEGQFTSNDAYLYYWQAQVISEQGYLPARDMHRWFPLGRDLGQTLNFIFLCSRLCPQSTCVSVSKPIALSSDALRPSRLFLHRAHRALLFPLPHVRNPLCKHRRHTHGDAPWHH